MPAGDAHARALLGVLVRSRQRFDLGALHALNPDLTATQLAAALDQEQQYARSWEANARDRIRRRLAADPSLQTSLGMLPRERNILANHIAVSGLRMTARGDLAKLRANGETHGYWLRSDRPWLESCEECRSRSGRLWPLDFLERHGPPRHPNCGCKVISPAAARAWGMPIGDPIPITEALREAHKRKMRAKAVARVAEATGGVLAEVERVEAHALSGGLTPGAAQRLARVLREAVAPVWREADHPRWPRGHPLGGEFRRKVDIGDVHPSLQPGLDAMAHAAAAGDMDAVDRAYDDMVKAAKKLGKERGDAIRAATRARAGVLNPRGLRLPTGATLDVGDGHRVPIPLGVPRSTGGVVNGPWTELSPLHSTFMWEFSDGELGPGHPQLLQSLRDARSLEVSDLPDGRVRVQSAKGRTEAQANGDARRWEILMPQLRTMRVAEPGVDLADSTQLDPHPEEFSTEILDERHRTWYPGISTRMLGDAAENVIDAVAARMKDLGLMDSDRVEFPSLASPDRNSPLDWVLGNRGIELKAQSMRSLTPGGQQRADTIDADERPSKIAEVKRRGLQPSLMHAVTDLDNDVVHMFLHDYPDPETMFKEIRPPQALMDRLVAGTLLPGNDETASTGADAGRGAKRWIFVGTFRLGYNPYFARLDVPPNLTSEELTALKQHQLQDSRKRAAGKAPLDVGVRAPVAPPMDRVTSAQAGREAVQQVRVDRQERDARIEQMARQGVKQDVIGEEFGITQARVSQILKARGVPVEQGRKPQPGLNDAMPRAARTAHATGSVGGQIDPGALVSRVVRSGVGERVNRAGGQRAALRREALAHEAAGLSLIQIARKMGVTVPYVMGLLAGPDPE